MMKMKLAVVTFVLGISAAAMAQPGNFHSVQKQESRQETPQNAEELAKQLDVSQDVANKAWAIYTDYTSKQRTMREKQREEMKPMRSKETKPTDSDVEKAFYAHLNSQRQVLDFEEVNYKKMTEILTPTQAVKLMRDSRHANISANKHRKEMREAAPPSDRMTREKDD